MARDPQQARVQGEVAETGLHQWPAQQPACVVRLVPGQNAQDQDVVLRLLEIGFLPGEPVRVIAAGFPGRDPLAVRVGHTTFALRRHEAAMIQVRAWHAEEAATP